MVKKAKVSVFVVWACLCCLLIGSSVAVTAAPGGSAGGGGFNPTPNPPTNLQATAGNASVALTWTASTSSPTGYYIKRGTTSGGTYTQIGSTSSTSYTDSTPSNGTTYYYVATAYNDFGESSYSNQVSATPQPPAPSAPTGVSATAGTSQATISWSTTSGATSYTVKRSTTSGSGYTNVATGVTGTSYTNTGLTNGTTYYFVVSASNGGGESPNSSQVSATPNTPPSAPTGVSAAAGTTQNVLSWSAASGAATYKVKRATTTGGTYTTIASAVSGTTYTDTGLTNGTTYYYVVAATNAFGDSSNSSEVSGKPIAAPTNLDGVMASNEVQLTWTTVAGASGYNVKRGTATGGPYTTIASSVSTGSYTDSTVTNSNSYFYVVTAVETGGESSNSGQLSLTLAAPSVAGSGLTATGGDTTVQLSWTSGSGSNAKEFKVWRKAASESTFTNVTRAVSTSTSFSCTDFGLQNGVSYSYYVEPLNVFGAGPASSTVSATPVSSGFVAGTGLTAEYTHYANEAVTKIDPAIDGIEDPPTGISATVPAANILTDIPDAWKCTWSGYVYAPQSGSYTIGIGAQYSVITSIVGDSGTGGFIRVCSPGHLTPFPIVTPVNLTAGNWYKITASVVAGFAGSNPLRLSWELPGTTTGRTIPGMYLKPAVDPAAPSGVTALGTTASTVSTYWEAVPSQTGFLGYKIYRSTTPTGLDYSNPLNSSYTDATYVSGGYTRFYADSSVSANQMYYYSVRAAYSNPVTGLVTLSSPTAVSADATTEDGIDWNASAADVIAAVKTAIGAGPDDEIFVAGPDGSSFDSTGHHPAEYVWSEALGAFVGPNDALLPSSSLPGLGLLVPGTPFNSHSGPIRKVVSQTGMNRILGDVALPAAAATYAKATNKTDKYNHLLYGEDFGTKTDPQTHKQIANVTGDVPYLYLGSSWKRGSNLGGAPEIDAGLMGILTDRAGGGGEATSWRPFLTVSGDNSPSAVSTTLSIPAGATAHLEYQCKPYGSSPGYRATATLKVVYDGQTYLVSHPVSLRNNGTGTFSTSNMEVKCCTSIAQTLTPGSAAYNTGYVLSDAYLKTGSADIALGRHVWSGLTIGSGTSLHSWSTVNSDSRNVNELFPTGKVTSAAVPNDYDNFDYVQILLSP